MKNYALKVTYLIITLLVCYSIGSAQNSAYNGKQISIYTTADSSANRISLTGTVTLAPAGQPLETENCIFVNPEKTFQTFLGIGGAITDASAEVFAKIPKDKQQDFLNAYFDKEKGIGYSLARTNINSCDFSSDSYTYVTEGDKSLSSFNIDHDRNFKIPLIKDAIKTAGGSLTLFASPWSPPAFMKTTNNMLQGGKLLPEFAPVWAKYYTLFIKAFEKEGIPVWGISVQNEPMAKQTWESCIYTAEEERDFLKLHLGPTMQKEGLGSKKIIVWDHNRDLMVHRANTIFSDPEAAKYAWGLGFHWYETWTGGQQMHQNVANVHESFPDKNLIFTEGCVERFNPEHYYYWPNAERYGSAILNDLNAGTVGWTDWNILLDEKGGPNHVGNFCFAPVHFDTQAGNVIYTPAYYYIGHFSKFIRPNAKRISSVPSRSFLMCTSFVNENGKIASVVMNNTSKPINYKFYVQNTSADITIPAHAIQTLVY